MLSCLPGTQLRGQFWLATFGHLHNCTLVFEAVQSDGYFGIDVDLQEELKCSIIVLVHCNSLLSSKAEHDTENPETVRLVVWLLLTIQEFCPLAVQLRKAQCQQRYLRRRYSLRHHFHLTAFSGNPESFSRASTQVVEQRTTAAFIALYQYLYIFVSLPACPHHKCANIHETMASFFLTFTESLTGIPESTAFLTKFS